MTTYNRLYRTGIDLGYHSVHSEKPSEIELELGRLCDEQGTE